MTNSWEPRHRKRCISSTIFSGRWAVLVTFCEMGVAQGTTSALIANEILDTEPVALAL